MGVKFKNVELIFHDARQEHPRKSAYYICCLENGSVETLSYSRKYDTFNAWDNAPADSVEKYSLNHAVAWWAKVPPKMRKQMNVRANNDY